MSQGLPNVTGQNGIAGRRWPEAEASAAHVKAVFVDSLDFSLCFRLVAIGLLSDFDSAALTQENWGSLQGSDRFRSSDTTVAERYCRVPGIQAVGLAFS